MPSCPPTPHLPAAALHLVLDAAGVVDHAHPGGVGSHVQALDDLGQEDLDLLELGGTDAAAAVDDEDDVGGPGFAQARRCARRREEERGRRLLDCLRADGENEKKTKTKKKRWMRWNVDEYVEHTSLVCCWGGRKEVLRRRKGWRDGGRGKNRIRRGSRGGEREGGTREGEKIQIKKSN